MLMCIQSILVNSQICVHYLRSWCHEFGLEKSPEKDAQHDHDNQMVEHEPSGISCFRGWRFTSGQVLLMHELLWLLGSLDQRFELVLFWFCFLQFSFHAWVSNRAYNRLLWGILRRLNLRFLIKREITSCFNFWVLFFDVFHFGWLACSVGFVMVAQFNLWLLFALFKPCIFEHAVINLALDFGHHLFLLSVNLALRIFRCTFSHNLHNVWG